MKIMFCGGGTAGHIYPALAMAEIAQALYPKNSVAIFVGRKGGGENDAVISGGHTLLQIDVTGLSKNPFKSIAAVSRALHAVRYSGKLIEQYSPDVVIGTGGYVCWPVIQAALKRGIPTAIHESNAFPGLVTRMLAPKCDAVLLGYSEAANHLKGKVNIFTVGNPTRGSFGTISTHAARKKLGIPKAAFLCVSFGGSLGSEAMNRAIIDAIPILEKKHQNYMHVHATGKRYYGDGINGEHKSRPARSRIMPYLDDVPTWFAAADLAITRSGAITLAELNASGLPAILIPSPNVSNNHQLKNAMAHAKQGGSLVLTEDSLSVQSIVELISVLIEHPEKMLTMRANARVKASEARSIAESFKGALAQLMEN